MSVKVSKLDKWIMLSLVVLSALAMFDFLNWRSRQIARLETGSSLVETSEGVVEYTTTGAGPAVLVLHGTLGGYDQAQALVRMLAGSSGRFILVSRPGYLRTPLATGASFEQQADAYAALLDELEIAHVVVMAASGGGPSALQFALRYPERCRGLVLLAANSVARAGDDRHLEAERAVQPPGLLANLLLSDVTSWAITRASQVMPGKVLAATVGAGNVESVMEDAGKYKTFMEFVDSLALLSKRREGSLNDGAQFQSSTGQPFERITCPTLILYGSQDKAVPFAEQAYLLETLQDSSYIEIEGGTHFMAISHAEVLAALITDFLNAHRLK